MRIRYCEYSSARHMVQDWLPSAGIFDHCIAVVPDGRTGRGGWIRPPATSEVRWHALPAELRTRTGDLSPNHALSSIPQTTGMPLTPSQKILTWVEVRRLRPESRHGRGRPGCGQPAGDGLEYETQRDRKDLHPFLRRKLPGNQDVSPIEIEMTSHKTGFKVTELHPIDNAWIKSDKDGKYRCDFYPSP